MADAYERHGRGHLDTIDVPLRRILFFDDTEENVDAARAIAKPALLVRSTADIEAALARIGITCRSEAPKSDIHDVYPKLLKS